MAEPVAMASREQIINNIRSILKSKTSGYSLSQFWIIYKQRFDDLPVANKFGLHKRTDFFSLLGDSVKIVGEGNDRKVILSVEDKTRLKGASGSTASGSSASGSSASKPKPKEKEKPKAKEEAFSFVFKGQKIEKLLAKPKKKVKAAASADSLTFETLSLDQSPSTSQSQSPSTSQSQSPSTSKTKNKGKSKNKQQLSGSVQPLLPTPSSLPTQPLLPTPLTETKSKGKSKNKQQSSGSVQPLLPTPVAGTQAEGEKSNQDADMYRRTGGGGGGGGAYGGGGYGGGGGGGGARGQNRHHPYDSPRQQGISPPGTEGAVDDIDHFPLLGATSEDVSPAAYGPLHLQQEQHQRQQQQMQQHFPQQQYLFLTPQHQQNRHFYQQHQQHQNPQPNHRRGGGGRGGYQSQQQQHNRGPTKTVDREQLEAVAKDRIECLCEAGELVTIEKVEALILQHYQVDSITCINNMRKIEDIRCVNQLMRDQCRVNAYIDAHLKVRSVATVHELLQCVQKFCCQEGDNTVKEWSSLHLGPFLQQPAIYDNFQAPTDLDEIPELDTGDILMYLREYLTEKNLWTDHTTTAAPFMEWLMDKRELDNPYKLCLRIKSIALLKSALKRAQRDNSDLIRMALAQSRNNIQTDLRNAAHVLMNTITDMELGHCALRRKYCLKPFDQVVNEFFQQGMALLDAVISVEQQCGLNHNTIRTLMDRKMFVMNFQKCLRKDPIFTALLSMAICCSKEEPHRQLADVMGYFKPVIAISSDDSSDSSDDSSDEEVQRKPTAAKKTQQRKRPALKDLLELAQKYLARTVSHGSVTLKQLSKVESKIAEEKGFPNFPEMGQGTFLDFLMENEDLKKVLEDNGGTMLGGSGSASTGGGTYHPTLADLIDFILQCNITEQKQMARLEQCLCQHYSVTSGDVRALGHGAALMLWQKSKTQSSHHRQHQQKHVLYQGALVGAGAGANSSQQSSSEPRCVGVLGPQKKENALSCLQNCPLLENLAEWSHWEQVFQPEIGSLKDFVQKYGGVHNCSVTTGTGESMVYNSSMLALETCPGTLLKLTCNTGPEFFSRAAQALDVTGTCGHLVSIVAVNGGLDTAPTALLANHVKTALLLAGDKVNGGDNVPGAPPTVSSNNTSSASMVIFILECLAKLPLPICQGVANQVFLEPLTSILGSTRSKELLLQLSGSSPYLESRLHWLGMALGVGEWTRSFQNRLQKDKSCMKRPERMDDGFGGVIEEEYEDVEEEPMVVQCIDLADSDDDLLSDDDSGNEEVKVIASVSTQADKLDAIQIDSKSSVTDGATPDDEDVTMDTNNDKKEADKEDKLEEKGENEEGTEEDRCKAIVDTIRKEEFGVDIKLSEDGEKLMQKQQERLGRSLDRLSKDLYSKDTHFVLELIQNADDNDYPEDMLSGDGSGPSVKFRVTKESIEVCNNENGFTEKNIRAICDVGRSTKGKHKYGYIGQKGIGFKSVFRVTDCPEVHSNGFHIKFDVNSGPMGYILPHWSPQEPSKSNDKWKTKIVLPLKPDLQQSNQSLAARFHDVHPSLLLFLHRLRNLIVINKAEDYKLTLQRRDLANNVVEIRHNKGVDRWLVVRHSLDASNISLNAKSGVEVESTEMALAFPMKLNKDQLNVVAEKQPVFAYLPLRSYGFRFIVQADFDVPSSREDVDRDSSWNQWLRSEIPTVFINALQTFKEHAEFDAIEAVKHFLQFIPLEDEILDFFRPVASAILHQLRSKPCLPTEPSSSDGKVQWKLPSQLVLTRDSLIHSVISSKLLQAELSLDYLHSGVVASMSSALMRALDIQTVRTEHLIHIGKTFLHGFEEKTEEEKEDTCFLITQWLACIYRSLDDLQENDAILDQLRAIPIIPLSGGRMVRLSEVTVFFPLDRSDEQEGSGKRRKGAPVTLCQGRSGS